MIVKTLVLFVLTFAILVARETKAFGEEKGFGKGGGEEVGSEGEEVLSEGGEGGGGSNLKISRWQPPCQHSDRNKIDALARKIDDLDLLIRGQNNSKGPNLTQIFEMLDLKNKLETIEKQTQELLNRQQNGLKPDTFNEFKQNLGQTIKDLRDNVEKLIVESKNENQKRQEKIDEVFKKMDNIEKKVDAALSKLNNKP